MRVHGNKTKRQGSASLGRRIVLKSKVVKVLRFGLMEATTLEISAMELNKAKVFIFGPMARDIRVIGLLMKCQARESSNGPMEEILRESLKVVLCTA